MLRRMKMKNSVLKERRVESSRSIARKEKRNLSQKVDEVLPAGFQKKRGKKNEKFVLPVFSMGSLKVNLGDRNALEALMSL